MLSKVQKCSMKPLLPKLITQQVENRLFYVNGRNIACFRSSSLLFCIPGINN